VSVERKQFVICLFGEPEDRELLWLAAALRQRGEDVEFVLPEELMIGSALSYRIEESANPSSLRLHDGRVIDASRPGVVVVNRLATLPLVRNERSLLDTSYLNEEWRAVLAAWLRTLPCPVLNPPRAGSLAGPMMVSSAVWCAIAHHCGLPTSAWRSNEVPALADPMEVVCLGSVVFDAAGSIPSAMKTSLAEMGRFVATPLLGATIDRRDDQWVFVDATTWPTFSAAGEPFVDAVLACAREGVIR